MKMMQRRFVTLIEMMVVMVIIALISGAILYNFRGGLDEGKAFKTKTGIERLETILNMKISENPSLADNIQSNWQDVVKGSPLVKNAGTLIKDGWGDVYEVDIVNGEVRVRSRKYDEYVRSHPQTSFGKTEEED